MLPIYKDSLNRHLFATDASMYEEVPAGVCFPTSEDDVIELVTLANTDNFSITARAAGTSLAGQTTGNGIIADISKHMTSISAYNPDKRESVVEPGVIRDEVNRIAAQDDLLFGPDTSTTNRCMIGGMIGNNSSGSYSIKYGTTRQHVKKMRCVLSDASTAEFRPVTVTELENICSRDSLEGHIYREMIKLITEHKSTIETHYPHPDIIRRNTGYALDALCKMKPFTPDGPDFNLCELLCGSEGTLAFTTEATLNLVPLQKHKTLVLPHFNSLDEAMRATVTAVSFQPSAVELIDYHILEATKENSEQNRNRFFLQGEPKFLLMIECLGDSEEEVLDKARKIEADMTSAYSCPILSEPTEIKRAWDLRKAGLGLLMGKVSNEKTPTFAEDTAVRVQDLPDYITEYQRIMKKYGTDCVYYAHASVGELHLRPVVDLKNEAGITMMKNMADEIANLVKKYKGSLSGEHGDGRARSNLIGKVLSEDVVSLLQKVKQIWDPKNIFNPGKIVNPKPIDQNLRFHPAYKTIDLDTVFNWNRYASSFGEAIEMCNGAGACRKTEHSGGTMCPSYMATKNEKDSTRGRANILRQMFSEHQQEAFSSEEIKDALQLCLSCKACKSECPASVDMAALKAEFTNGWHKEHGYSLSDLFFANPDKLYPLASFFASLSNAITSSGPGKELFKTFFNIDKKRTLPSFATRPYHKNRIKNSNSSAPKVVLLVDYFTNYHTPEIAEHAQTVLEALGYAVIPLAPFDSGRTKISRGFLDKAVVLAEKNINKLISYVEGGYSIIGLEPSEILTFRDEYLDLFFGDLHIKAQKIADKTLLLEEFVMTHPDDHLESLFNKQNVPVLIHGHCHYKALTDGSALTAALSSAGYLPEVLDAGCCGMAGSFGYETQNYSVSMTIANQRLLPAIDQNDDMLICSQGFSCTHQIFDGSGKRSHHPAQLLYRALK